MSTEVQLMTADELLALPRGQFRYELINGGLKKMAPAYRALDAGNVIPGFQIVIAEVFAD